MSARLRMGAAAVAVACLSAACNSGTASAGATAAKDPRSAAPPTTDPTSVTTGAGVPSAPSTTTTATSMPGPRTAQPPGVVGMVLSGAGNSFTAPLSPTVKPFSSDCRTLLDPGYYGQCITVVAASGTIAAVVEVRKPTSQTSGPAPAPERDLVYHKQGSSWDLVLRRTYSTNTGIGTMLYESDVQRDGDPKAVFVRAAPNPRYGNELDLVEGTGKVTLYRQLHGGFALVPPGGGLRTFVPARAGGYHEALIKFERGAWRIVSLAHVTGSQARAESDGPFNDPEATFAS